MIVAAFATAFFTAFSTNAFAEKADRDKPINIESNSISVDEINKTQIFEGNVVMIQGTTELRANRLVVTQDADGFQKGVATGGDKGLARFRQKRDDKNEYIEGEAEKIEHNAKNEKTEFFVRAWVKNGQDEVRGNYISYESLTEKFTATSGGQTRSAKGEADARVKAIIQPKSQNK